MNKARLQQLMKAEDLDAVVAMSYENVYYMTGASIHTQRSIPDRLAIVVWPVDEDPTFIVCVLEEAQAKEDSWIEDVRSYFEFQTLPVELLADVLKERGLVGKRVGVELKYLVAHDYIKFSELVPDLDMVDASDLLERVRMIKTPEEIGHLKEAAQATEAIIRQGFEGIKVGMTEAEINAGMQIELLRRGATPAFSTLAAGVNSTITHPVPGDYKVKEGDIVRTDIGGYFHEYLSDLARTCVVGKSNQRQRDVYRWLWDTHEELISRMTPGLKASELYNLCKKLYEDAGMAFNRPHIGHGLGISVHEPPLLNPYTEIMLQPGMVICIEPNHLIPGVEKYHDEDTVLITENGPEVISRSKSDWSELLVVG